MANVMARAMPKRAFVVRGMRSHLESNTAMHAKQLRDVKKMGGRVTTVRDFLGLTTGEDALVAMHVEVAGMVKQRPQEAGVTQVALAKGIGSTQAARALSRLLGALEGPRRDH
jgi:hypothetical protein